MLLASARLSRANGVIENRLLATAARRTGSAVIDAGRTEGLEYVCYARPAGEPVRAALGPSAPGPLRNENACDAEGSAMLLEHRSRCRDDHGGANKRWRGAFTLAELLIAVAILGVGLSMIATLFPAALRENQRSTDDVLGSIICQNGLAVAKARYSHRDDVFTQTQLMAKWVGQEAWYPQGDTTHVQGFYLFGRRTAVTTNDYQLVIVAFRKSEGGALSVPSRSVTISDFDDGRSKAVFTDISQVQVGSPLILRATGQWAWIEAVDASTKTVVLDRKLPPAGGNAFVFGEAGAPESPAIGVLVARTSFRE